MAVEVLLGEKGSRNQTQMQVEHKDHYIQSLRQSSVCIPTQNRILRETHYQHRFPWLLWNGQCRHIQNGYQYLGLDYHILVLQQMRNHIFKSIFYDTIDKLVILILTFWQFIKEFESLFFVQKSRLQKFIVKVWLVSILANAHLIWWWFI